MVKGDVIEVEIRTSAASATVSSRLINFLAAGLLNRDELGVERNQNTKVPAISRTC